MRSSADSITWVLAGLLIGGALFLPAASKCQELEPVERLELPDMDSPCGRGVSSGVQVATVVYNGLSGTWFHPEVARCILPRLEVLPDLMAYTRMLETRSRAADQLMESLRRRGDLAVEEAERARAVLTEAVRARRVAEEELDAWYRAPALWFALGGVAVVALVAVAVWALDSVRAE